MDIFQQNLDALRQHRPELAARVESLGPLGTAYRIHETPGGWPTLEYLGGKEPVWWHSRHDPRREVERELAALDHGNIQVPLLAGIGLGYTLRRLWDTGRADFFDLVVLEADPCGFRLALQITRLDDILADPRARFYLGPDLTAWPALVCSLMPAVVSSTLRILPHRPSLQCHAAFYQSALETVKQQISLTRAEFDLMVRTGPHIQENLWLNLPAVLSSISLVQARGGLKGRPAVVIAAGPSLDRNVHLLKDARDRAALIAVDTACRTLERHGIAPHVVVTTDPTELNRRHFEGLAPMPETILAFDPEVDREIPRRWPGRTLFLNLDKTVMTRWLESECGPWGILPKGGSVGHTAFYLARELDANPILFVGLDLAFDPHGGTTHAAASALRRSHAPIGEGARAAELGPRADAGAIQEEMVWVPAVEGRAVPTSRIMSLYIQRFEEDFARTQARLIDATEGGARLRGTEIMLLSEALRQLPPTGGAILSFFDSLQPPRRDRSAVHHQLDHVSQALEAAAARAREGIRLSTLLIAQVRKGTALRDTPEWQAMEACFSFLYDLHHNI
ncbi:MAG: motility associated factor glycosyltransferase family protein [bacterium]